jgi:hypothetical protein
VTYTGASTWVQAKDANDCFTDPGANRFQFNCVAAASSGYYDQVYVSASTLPPGQAF